MLAGYRQDRWTFSPTNSEELLPVILSKDTRGGRLHFVTPFPCGETPKARTVNRIQHQLGKAAIAGLVVTLLVTSVI